MQGNGEKNKFNKLNEDQMYGPVSKRVFLFKCHKYDRKKKRNDNIFCLVAHEIKSNKISFSLLYFYVTRIPISSPIKN